MRGTRKNSTTHTLAQGIGCVFQVASAVANAQKAFPPTLDDPYYASVLPKSGAYYDPTRSGTGIFVDMRQDGSAFVVLGVYDAAGAPRWYTSQGTYFPTHAYGDSGLDLSQGSFSQVWYRPASLGSYSAPMFYSSGGQCLGCEYTAPTTRTAEELGGLSLVWTAPAEFTLTLGATQSQYRQLPLDDVGSGLRGRWHLAAWHSDFPSAQGQIVDALVELQPAEDVAVETAAGGGNAPVLEAPAHVTDWYRVTCVEHCEHPVHGLDFWQPSLGGSAEIYLWVDADNGAAGLGQYVRRSSGETALAALPGRLEFEARIGDGVITGRRSQRLGANAFLLSVTSVEGSLLRMERMEPAPN